MPPVLSASSSSLSLRLSGGGISVEMQQDFAILASFLLS